MPILLIHQIEKEIGNDKLSVYFATDLVYLVFLNTCHIMLPAMADKARSGLAVGLPGLVMS